MAWELRKLGELASKTYGGGTPTTSNDEFWNGTIPWIQSSDLIEHQVFGVHPRKYITKEAVMNSATKIVPENALAIITRVGVGKLAVIPFSYTTSQDFLSLSELKTDVKFTAYLLYKKLQCELIFVQGTSIKGITKDELLSKIVFVPERKEQEAISAFFANLDNLITLHQRKLDKMKELKKAFLNLIFSQKLRFRGFTESWELRKLKDITYPAGEKNRENLPLDSYSITNEHGFIPQDERFENGGTMREADKKMYYIVSPHSFAYNPARINIGSIGYQNTDKNVIVSSLYEVFKTSDDVDDRLLWHWFKSSYFQKLIEQFQEGGVRLYFYYDKLCMGTLSLPSFEEQHKIGKYLDTYDNLITLRQEKINQLTKLKTTFLKNMFI
ncbi:restriction endonuclease subunit S [Phascolarctobacterium faecium]|uniref:restriction endonuclease subunit S n=1 Tax=Phascolarctobacterium faecium TaxID=33025 RepID=UPI003AB8373E